MTTSEDSPSNPRRPPSRKGRSRRPWIIAAIALPLLILGLAVFTPLGTIAYVVAMNQVETTRFEVRGDELWMNGEINSKTLDQFVEVMDANPSITTLVEEIVPGSLDDDTMIALAYEVRKRGLNTRLLA